MRADADWVNPLKTFGILSVILGHIASPFTPFIFSWHMPLFFFIGGLFLTADRPNDEFVRKQFHRLIIPFILFLIIGIGAEALKRLLLHRPTLEYGAELHAIVWMDVPDMHHYGFVLWFLPALFIAKIMLFWLLKHFGRFGVAIAGLLSILLWTLFGSNVSIPFGIDQGIIALSWVASGYVFMHYGMNRLKVLAIVALIIVVTVSSTLGIPHLNIAASESSDPLISYLYGTSVIIALIAIFSRWKSLHGNRIVEQ